MNGEVWPVTRKNFNNLSLKKKVEILNYRKTLDNTIELLLLKRKLCKLSQESN
jgi:hypothetical protein